MLCAEWASSSGERGQPPVLEADHADPARQVGRHQQGLQFSGGNAICGRCVDGGFGLHGSRWDSVSKYAWLVTGRQETPNMPTAH